jgi:hypothetical protein
MSPLLFLAIPLVIFAVGSFILYMSSQYRSSGFRHRKAPADLRSVAPMLKEQREAGWPVRQDHYTRR